MKGVRLVATSNDYDTEPGFALYGADTRAEGFAADRTGIMVAHDLLEHVNGAREIGSVWDELEALGALCFVRGQFGDMLNGANHHPLWYNLSGDITRMFAEWRMAGCYEGPAIPRSYVLREWDWLEDQWAQAIARAVKDIPSEDSESFSEECRVYGESPENARADLKRYAVFALERMRVGFRKARRRYRIIGAQGAFDQFRAIRDAVKEAISENELYEGAEFILSYGNARAFVRPTGEELL